MRSSSFQSLLLLEYIYIKGVSSSPFIIEVVRWGTARPTHVHMFTTIYPDPTSSHL